MCPRIPDPIPRLTRGQLRKHLLGQAWPTLIGPSPEHLLDQAQKPRRKKNPNLRTAAAATHRLLLAGGLVKAGTKFCMN